MVPAVGDPENPSADEFSASERSFSRMADPAPCTIAFAVKGPLARGDLSGLCARVCALLEGAEAALVVCDVSGIAPDAVAVDALARLQLAVRRHGCEVRLRHASAELRELVALIGLEDILVEA